MAQSLLLKACEKGLQFQCTYVIVNGLGKVTVCRVLQTGCLIENVLNKGKGYENEA